MTDIDTEIALVFQTERPTVIAALTRMSGDIDAAEDAFQEALIIAANRWAADGLPANPGGWLMTTAKRRLIDGVRRSEVGHEKERLAGGQAESAPSDDRLTLIFTCCHPALSLENRVALTLRTICGLSTEEIAAGFLVSTETMAKRLVRAKKKIRVARIAYQIPDPEQWEPRLAAVLATIYLMFNRSYDLGSNNRRGLELSDQAIQLARLLDLLIPDEPEIEGLLALMLFTSARALARFASDGSPVLFEDQDRELWNTEMITEAHRLTTLATRHGSLGQYWIQAAIAGEHTMPTRHQDRDWRTIVALYDKLLDQTGQSPVVQLNRALAFAEVHGPDRGLEALADLDNDLQDYPLLSAARADLHRQAGRTGDAAAEYRKAIDLMVPGQQQDTLKLVLQEIC